MIEQSESIAALATALAKAQGVMGGALKDSANPFFKSRYADLESVWSACRKPLADNGLAVIQGTSADDTGVTITTTLAHTSGEWMRSSLRLLPKEATPQGVGSAISYGRRYALAGMVGVYQTDDDAEAAHGRITPQGDASKRADGAKAAQIAQRMRNAVQVGIDQAAFDIHCEVVDDQDLYIAASDLMSAGERRAFKEAIGRAREAQPRVLANGRAAPVVR
jgi:hypothetical protein